MKKNLLILTILLAAGAGPASADTIELRNGRIIHGKVIGELPATGPVRITFTGGGSLTLEPDRILRVLRDSSCDFRTATGKPGSDGIPKGAKPAEKKPGELPKKPEEKKRPVEKTEQPDRTDAEPIDAKLEAEILGYISELSRQRSQNRVRAEAALKRLGPVTLPYLEKAAVHPFALTRRAVVRIAAAAGGEASDKLLRAALEDKDEWVRKIAREALGKRTR